MPRMHHTNAIKEDGGSRFRELLEPATWSLLVIFCCCSCNSVSEDRPNPEGLGQETFLLQTITAERGQVLLSDLGLGIIASAADPNTLLLSGSPNELEGPAMFSI